MARATSSSAADLVLLVYLDGETTRMVSSRSERKGEAVKLRERILDPQRRVGAPARLLVEGLFSPGLAVDHERQFSR